MRKLLFVFALLVSFCGSAFAAYDEGTAIHNKELSKGSAADPVRVYQLVRYPANGANDTSISGGEVLFWDVVSDDGVTINRFSAVQNGSAVAINTGATSSDSVAGIAVGTFLTADTASSAANSIGSRNWGYVQTYGLTTAMVQSTAAAGQALAANDTLVDGAYCLPVTAANGGLKAGSIFAFAVDAASSDASGVEVFVKNR
jgi:hypothetical protein